MYKTLHKPLITVILSIPEKITCDTLSHNNKVLCVIWILIYRDQKHENAIQGILFFFCWMNIELKLLWANFKGGLWSSDCVTRKNPPIFKDPAPPWNPSTACLIPADSSGIHLCRLIARKQDGWWCRWASSISVHISPGKPVYVHMLHTTPTTQSWRNCSLLKLIVLEWLSQYVRELLRQWAFEEFNEMAVN